MNALVDARRLSAILLSGLAIMLAAAPSAASAHYVNPLKYGNWAPGRIDMGVDYVPLHRERVVAIGRAEVLGIDYHSSWPAKHYIYYQLLDGNHKGDVIYVAEHLGRMAKVGAIVPAGGFIAMAKPGYPFIETGFASINEWGQPRALPCYREGHPTHSGREFLRFMKRLGAPVIGRPGPVSEHPYGKRC